MEVKSFVKGRKMASITKVRENVNVYENIYIYIYINVYQCRCFHLYVMNVQMKKKKCGFLDFKLC